MADFGILHPMPNFAQAALGGFQAGQQMRKQGRADEALSNIDLDRPESVLPLLRSDPAAGAALLAVAEKRQVAAQEVERQKRVQAALTGLGGGQAQPQGVAAQAPVGGDIAQSDQGQLGGLSRPSQSNAAQYHPDLQSVYSSLMQAGAKHEEVDSFLKMTAQLGKDQAAKISDQQNALATIASAMPPDMPMDQRKQFVLSHKADLMAHGVPEAKIDGYEPTDINNRLIINTAVGIEKALQFTHNERTAAETSRHNKVEEGQGAARIAISGGELKVHQGALGLANKKEGRIADKSTGGAPNASGLSTEALLNLANGGR